MRVTFPAVGAWRRHADGLLAMRVTFPAVGDGDVTQTDCSRCV